MSAEAAGRQIGALDEGAKAEVREAVRAVLANGLGDFKASLLAQILGVERSDGATSAWRNIHYGDVSDRRLPVFWSPDLESDIAGSIPFGERLEACQQTEVEGTVWLRLGEGCFKGKWVAARRRDAEAQKFIVHCINMGEWQAHPRRVPSNAFQGQHFPQKGMYTEGYAGSKRACLVSASGDAMWREINIEMLFRDIGTATVFEEKWGGDANFTEWVAHYATNCVVYGRLGSPGARHLVVTVRPTSRWKRYGRRERCLGPRLEDVKDDVGRAQFHECTWLHATSRRLHINWDKVEFMTAFCFLQTHCRWTEANCQEAAFAKIASVVEVCCSEATYKDCEYAFELGYWSCDEAFHSNLPQEVCEAIAKCELCCAARFAQAKGWPLPGALGDAWRLLGEVVVRAAFAQLKDPVLGPFAEQALYKMGQAAVGRHQQVVAEYLRNAEWRACELAFGVLDYLGPEVAQRFAREMSEFRSKRSQGLYCVGGVVNMRTSAAVECYDESQGWMPMASMRTPRQELATAVLQGKLYAIGGHDGNCTLSTVERFDPLKGMWSLVTSMSTRRRDHAATALDGAIHVVGGDFSGEALAGCERYDPQGMGSWRATGQLRLARASLATASFRGFVYAIGGRGGAPSREEASVERLHPSTDAWERAASLCVPRSGHAAVVLQGALYAVGGHAERSLERLEGDFWSLVEPPWQLMDRSVAAVARAGAILVLGRRRDQDDLPSAKQLSPGGSVMWTTAEGLTIRSRRLFALSMLCAEGAECQRPCARQRADETVRPQRGE